MVKFASHDAEYDRVASIISQILQMPTVQSKIHIHRRVHSLVNRAADNPEIGLTEEVQLNRPNKRPAEDMAPSRKRPRTSNNPDEDEYLVADGDSNLQGLPSHSEFEHLKQPLIDKLHFNKIDERLTHLTPAQGTTCRWFLTKPEYMSWHDIVQQPDHGGFLWIRGNPGTGKLTLMKYLFETAKLKSKSDPLRITLSFFFLARGTDEEKTTTGLYRSLLHQLFEKASDLRDSLEWMTVDGARIIASNGWHEEALKQTLMHAIRKLENRALTVFIDALDECNEKQVAGMVCFFEELCDCATEANVSFKVCFSSRHYPTIVIQKGIEFTLEDAIGHADDIRQYTRSRLRLGKTKPAEQIRSDIVDKSSGIFLWVVLVIDILNSEYPQKSISINRIREHLKKIPPKLNDLFEMILKRDGDNLEGLQLCLRWVLFASRPLKPQELYFTIQVGCDKECFGYWDQEDVDLDSMKTFVRSCSKGLAEVTRNKASEVQFIHESVRDFLLGKYESQWSGLSGNFTGHAHESLRDCCVAQLKVSISQYVEIPNPLPKASEGKELRANITLRFPFLEYSILNVFYHANASQQHGIQQRDFLADFQLRSWVTLNNALERYATRRYTEAVSLLYVLAKNNVADLIGIHPLKKSCFEVEAERYGAPALAAVVAHSHEAVRAFVKAFADDESPLSLLHTLCRTYRQAGNKRPWSDREFTASRGDSIFTCLCIHGNEAIVFTFLLASPNFDVNLKRDMYDQYPLISAAENGHEAVVRLLLERGANIESKDTEGRTAISVAAENGQLAVVNLLLQQGANCELEANSGHTPVSFAICRGHEDVVRLLLGTDIEVKSTSGRTLLSWAAESINEAMLRFFLDKGLDIESKCRDGRTPLSYAAAGGNESIVRIMLEHNADIRSKDKYGWMPLWWAVRMGHRGVAKLLLEVEHDIESKDMTGRTLLSWAVVWSDCHADAVVELLEKGADIESKDKDGRTPLSWAVKASLWRDNSEVIDLLLQKGADVESKDGDGLTPLLRARALLRDGARGRPSIIAALGRLQPRTGPL